MTMTAAQQKKQARQRLALQQERAIVSVKEVLLVVLVAVLAAVSIYGSRDDHTAFGLLNGPVYATDLPIITSFRTAALVRTDLLVLSTSGPSESTEQVVGQYVNPLTPPPVTMLSALNTHVGGEILLSWVFPLGVDTIDVYRRVESADAATEERIAEAVRESTYLDQDAKNGERYVYRVVSVVTRDDQTYSSSPSPTVVGVAADTIPPGAPVAVTVESHERGDVFGLLIQWQHPMDEDLDRVDVYRSAQYGVQGDVVGTAHADEAPQWFDVTAPAATSVYYTLVAVDRSGNSSVDPFSIPLPGNAQPFTPIDFIE